MVKKVKMVYLLLLINIVLFPLCVSAKTTVKEWTEEDNNKTQPMISVSLKFGQTVTNKIVSKTVTGNIKENDEDEIYDYTETTITERTISATASTVKTSIIENSSELTGIVPVYDKKKQEINTGYFNEPHEVSTTEKAPNGYDYQFVGLGDYSQQFVAFVNVNYAKDKNGKTLKDKNGNYVIESITTQEGEIITSNGVKATNFKELLDSYSSILVVQALLENEDGNAVYAYCADIEIDGNIGSWYTITNLEDNDYYATKEAEDHIRAITMNGYWGTASDANNDGKYDIGSLALVKQNLKKALADGKLPKEITVTYKENEEIKNEVVTVNDELIDSLTEGEALDMTQAAIWAYSNGSLNIQDGRDGWLVVNTAYGDTAEGNRKRKSNDPNGMARMELLYNWLVNLKAEGSSTLVINEKNYLENFSLTIGNKITEGTYEASLNFDLSYEPTKEDNLVIYLTYEDIDGTEKVITKRISGTAKSDDELIEKTENGYVISGLKLKENTDLKFSLRLEGYQYLEFGTYVFNAEGGINKSQTLVGVAEGKHNVNINRDIVISFDVEDDNKYYSKRRWKEKSYEEMPPNTGITIDDLDFAHSVQFILRELFNY